MTRSGLPTLYRVSMKFSFFMKFGVGPCGGRKDIPVIVSPTAASIVQRLGFTDVRSLAHGTSTQIPGLQVCATIGGRVGAPWAPRENGFVLQEMLTGLRYGRYAIDCTHQL